MRLLWLFMFVFGLALCNQQTILLFVPAFAVLGWQGRASCRGRPGRSGSRCVTSVTRSARSSWAFSRLPTYRLRRRRTR